MLFEISFGELRILATGRDRGFPKYASPLINLANQFAQATRPRVVGQLSELIQRCPARTFAGWRSWYLKRYPRAIDVATKRIWEMLGKFKDVINRLDEGIVREWVEDLVLVKTFVGLRLQEPILRKLASMAGVGFRLARPDEEARGIDGFVGNLSVSIKPETYRVKARLPETLQADVVIYYDKKKDSVTVDTADLFDRLGKGQLTI